jgi:hypothetical protein
VLTMTIKYFAFSTFFALVMIDIGIPHTKLNYERLNKNVLKSTCSMYYHVLAHSGFRLLVFEFVCLLIKGWIC